MDEENKNQIDDKELEQVSGGKKKNRRYTKCPKCKRNNASMSNKCKYCGIELK